jgi:tRNA threonylcarbamoyladenosine biosynthesis protein TsaB
VRRLISMLILAADTSGKNGSLALVRFEAGASQMLGLISLEGGNFSAQLVPQISDLLKKHGLSKSDIDGFAVAVGPGSFTGLRVGLAAIKALAEILRKPIAAVSLLEAVARAAGRDGSVLAALDAGRSEIYCGEYEISGTRAKLIAQQLWSEAEFINGAGGRVVVTPDARIAEFARQKNLQVILIAPLQADAIAKQGFEKIQAGDTTSPEALDASYIRRSDAEVMKGVRDQA